MGLQGRDLRKSGSSMIESMPREFGLSVYPYGPTLFHDDVLSFKYMGYMVIITA